MRKILAAAAAAAFVGTMFTSSPASADCVEITSGNPYVIGHGPWGPIYAPGNVGVDPNPRDCISSAEAQVDELIQQVELEELLQQLETK